MTADISQLKEWEHDLVEAAAKATVDAVKVVKRGAGNVKKGWINNAKITAGKHARAYPYSVTYDIEGTSAEIGPDKSKRQGALGNLMEYGSSSNPPHNDGGRALDTEAPLFIEWAAKIGTTRLIERRSVEPGGE